MAQQLSQSQILVRLGFQPSQFWEFGANVRAQQYANMQAARKGLPMPFAPSAASALIQDVLPLAVIGGAAAAGGDAGAGAAAGAGDTGAGGAAAGAGKTLLSASAHAIKSPLDFLMAIAWVFHPRSILRGVEFLLGIALMVFGLSAALQGRGERLAGFTSGENALSRSALGRVADELGAAARRRGSSGSSQESPRQPRKVSPAPHKRRESERRQRHERGERAIRTREQRERRLSEQQQRRTGGSKTQY